MLPLRKGANVRGFKAQSAMEYLMTYGWAILTIAVVLGALFALGVFSSLTIGTSCVAMSGYYCQYATLSSTGSTGRTLTFTLGQNTGSTMYNAIVGVSPQGSAINGLGFPTDIVQQAGTAGSTSNGIATFTSENTNSVTIALTPTELPVNTIGQVFTGYVWINYSTTSGGTANRAEKVATINVKVT